MIELKNITFVEYFELEDKSEYDFAINFAYSFNKPVDHFGVGDLMKQSFGIVKDIQYDLTQGLTWEQFFEYLKKMGEDKAPHKKQLLTLCQQRSYIIKEIESIVSVEEIELAYASTEDDDNAGIGNFEGLGIYLQIRSLTGGDVTKNKAVLEMPYEDCFLELVTRKRIYDFEELKRKNKI